jgi:ABC-type antimicrobial peptide transport system permease subunit
MPSFKANPTFPSIVFLVAVAVQISFPEYFSGLFDFSPDLKDLAGLSATEVDAKYSALATYNISTLIFWLALILLSLFSFRRKWQLIPLLGLSTCLYLLTGMTANNWIWFFAWFAIGLIIYFAYGYKRSKLAHE